eukprot:TRINITY_DN79461_c0_g1_i1.p1 TRINITY_DN79461_c0_g1~~TRINITY_DN79461_c0_g1_i1.p1  ORF type:complete len:716 (-),score=201.26 TRINITY_DN79461_c0_g1_i1:177-2102(-)
MSMSAFVSFGEELDHSLMAGYAHGIMEKLVNRLQTTNHRGVREECITSIAVIAGVIQKDFSKYYDGIMPILKQIIMTAKGDKESRLRGKSFECLSLLGIAVGKEKFGPDAQEAVAAMLQTTPSLEADDIQREYIKEASERICQCLKKDFAPFLQHLLPGIFKNMRFESLLDEGGGNTGDDEGAVLQFADSGGKMVKVKTQKLEELGGAVSQLWTFVSEMESGFFDYIKDTAQVLLPLIQTVDEKAFLFSDALGPIVQVWALLIKSARLGAQERNQPPEMVKQLFTTGLQGCLLQVDKAQAEIELDVLVGLASGISECVKNAGQGSLGREEVHGLAQRVFTLIDESFKRSSVSDLEKAKAKQEGQSLPEELREDDDEDEWQETTEDMVRRGWEEVLGALMEVAPQEFMPILPECSNRIQQYVAKEDTKVLGLHIACDLLNYLKEQSESAWPVFMPALFSGLLDKEAEVRTAASYAVGLAAECPKFAEAAPQAYKLLAQVLNAARPKKRDDKGKVAWDNAVAAMFALVKAMPQHCPPEVKAWEIVIQRLPLKDDEEEAKKVHAKVVDLFMAQNEGMLGGPDKKNVGPVLAILSEIYKTENMCSKEIDEKILQVFKMIPAQMLGGLASTFTEKQQKKIEKMLSA